MAGSARRIEIEIFGQSFSVMADDEARLREVAAYVDRQMKELSRSTSTVDSFRLAVLAALNIADERRDLETRAKESEKAADAKVAAMSEKAARLAQAVDQALAEAS